MGKRADGVLMVLDLLNFIFMMTAAAAPLYVAYKVRRRSRRLLALALIRNDYDTFARC